MSRNSNTIMHKVWGILTSIYHFLMRGDWKRIQLGSGRPQQAFWMDYRLWITPYECFQFWNFWQKLQSLYEVWGAASRFLALGLAFCICMGRIRVEIWVHNPLHWWIKYLISMESFSIFSSWRTCQFAQNLSFFDVHEILSE